MDKKLIFFDIDGTLLDHDKQLPKSTKLAIEKLQELGHELAIATGRAPFMFEELREELGIHTYVGLNGQYVVHNNQVVYEHPLDIEELQRYSAFADELDHPLIFENHEQMYSTKEANLYVDEGIGSFKLKVEPIYEPNSFRERKIYQSLLFCTEEHELLYHSKFQKLKFVRFHEYAVDVLPADGSKAKGIEALINHLQIPMKNVYAFGDALNDLEMMTFVENSVAMGNAIDEVKQVAKYVTTPVDEDGILKGLELVGIL